MPASIAPARLRLPRVAPEIAEDLLRAFPELPAHPFDAIRKDQYKDNAHGWYFPPEEWPFEDGTYDPPEGEFEYFWSMENAYQWARNTLLRNGYSTAQFHISTTRPDPEGFSHENTLWVYRVDQALTLAQLVAA